MKFIKPNLSKLVIFVVSSILFLLSNFVIWKPYFTNGNFCIDHRKYIEKQGELPLRRNLFRPGIQIAYIWKTALIYPTELIKIGNIGFQTFQKSPVETFYKISDYIVQNETNRNIFSNYKIRQILLLIFYRYLIICIISFLLKYWRIVLLIPIFIAFIITIYALIFSKEYLSDMILSFLPYLFVGNIIVILLLIILLRPRIFGDKKSNLIKKRLGLLILIFPISLSLILGNKYFDFYRQDKIIFQENIDSIKILSANIYIYNRQLGELKKIIEKENPDVLILTEYNESNKNNFGDFLSKNYPYRYDRIFSRYPIKNTEIGKKYIKANIIKDEKVYNLYAIHTTSPMNPKNFISRNKQISEITKTIGKNINNEQNIIIIGDFNVTPRSYYYKELKNIFDKNLVNLSSIEFGNVTRRDARIPFFQSHIDYVWINKNIKTKGIRKIKIPGSDHDGFLFEIR